MSAPVMDESICLDDDSILSDPSGATEPPSQPDSSPTHEGATDCGTEGENSAGSEDAETARILAEAKSMENILLESENSPTLPEGVSGNDEGVSVMDPSSESPDNDRPAEASTAETQEAGKKGESQETTATISHPLQPSQENSPQDAGPQLSSYFGGGAAEKAIDDSASFFDHLSGGGQLSPPGTGQPAGSTSQDLPAQEEVIRERTLSVASEEATPVSFEEVKGSGLKFVGSMESVTKFFKAAEAGTEDGEEGKEFFDSFTAGATGDLAAQPPTSAPGGDGLAGPISPPVAIPGTNASVPPETPPIPHEPMSMSPLPSPIHTSFMRQRSISQSQGSPAPSPIHTNNQPQDGSLTTPPEPGDISSAPLTAAFPSGEDLFTAGLNMSDADRRNDAWIPTESTRQSLVTIVTSAPGSYVLEQEQLTSPGIVFDDPLGDPVQELVQRFMGEAEANKRITLTVDDVPKDTVGLRKLISAECWRSAADLTATLLEAHSQGAGKQGHPSKHSTESIQLWFCRMALLIKLRLYTQAETECQAFGNLDRPDLYYEYYPETFPGRRGSMVPFAFRILHAELPQFLGKAQESLDRLYYVQAITKKILANLESGLAEDGSMIQLSDESRKASRDLWKAREVRLHYAIGNCLLGNKDYAMAIDMYEDLLKNDENAKQEALLCGIGRVYLQMGDVKAAQRYFSKAETASDATNQEVKCRNLMNKGFVALGQNLFPEAFNYFKQATALNPTNAVAVNNMAVCSLYMGRLKDALTTLESLVHQDPARYLQEGILFNLCTLYELESSRALHKKQALLQLVSKHKGNGFNTACLKMT